MGMDVDAIRSAAPWDLTSQTMLKSSINEGVRTPVRNDYRAPQITMDG